MKYSETSCPKVKVINRMCIPSPSPDDLVQVAYSTSPEAAAATLPSPADG
jgi:phage FluMu protein Com